MCSMAPDYIDFNLWSTDYPARKICLATNENVEFALKHPIVASLILAAATASYAEANPLILDIEHICLRPSDAKSHLLIAGDGKVDGGVIVKLFGLHVDGSAHFTKEEWDGVQAALPPRDVASDSISYRSCVERLVPILCQNTKNQVYHRTILKYVTGKCP